jgi:hypothetical protein
MIRFRNLFAVLAGAALLVSACSSSKSSKAAKATTTTESPAQAQQEITTTWEAFFSPGTSSTSMLEDGAQLNALYQKNLSSPLAKTASAKVKTVQLLDVPGCQSPGIGYPCAAVTYDILLSGKPTLIGSKGYATKVNGKWLVSKTTFCALLALQNGGTPPAGC